MPVLLSRLHGFLPALAALAAAIALHFLMIAVFGKSFSGIFFVYLAAMLIGGWCGYLPGILVVLLVACAVPFLTQPNFSLSQVKLDGLAVLLLVSLMVSRTAATRRRIEQLLRGMNDELDRRVRRQTVELEQANAALRQQLAEIETLIRERDQTERERLDLLAREQAARAEADAANRAKDEFLAILGHELRNPLAAMSNGAVLLHSNPTPERRAWIEQMMERQVQQLQRLVGDLLDVTRVTRGKLELRKKRLELRTVLDHAVEAVRKTIEEQRHQLSVPHSLEAVFVEADAARLEQILVNLLSNAAKYTPAGGEISLAVERTDSDVVIRCRDNGIGMSAEVLNRIFEPFVQVKTSSDLTGSGLGMGLTLVKKLTELHGGSVLAASPGLGQGSEFTVRLPLAADVSSDSVPAEAAAQATAEPPRHEKVQTQMRRILLIEDNRELAMVTAELLRDRGQDVQLAFNGQEGIALAKEFRPDVILCDLNLPDTSGFEVAKSLREDESLSSALLVGVTAGYVEGYEPGRTAFDTFLSKPLVWAKLNELLSA